MRSKKALLNIVTNLLLEVIIVIYGFIVPKLIITSFGSNVNGLVSSITQFLAYIMLLESGFGPVVKSTLYKPIANKDKKTIANILKASERFFRIIAYIFILYIVVLSLLYPLLVNSEFGYVYTLSLIVIISISTFAEYYFGMTYRLYLQAEQQKYIISLLQIVTYLISIVLVVVLVKLNVSIHLIKLLTGFVFVLRPFCQNYYVKKKFNINLKEADSNFEIKQKWDGLAQHIAAVIHGNTDITVLTIFCNLGEVSVYSVYYLIVNGVKKIIQAFTGGIDSLFGNMLANGERETLNKRFSMYEVLYFSITTIFFASTIILIVPFVSVYTKGITDVNYIRYLFGYLIVISEFVWAVRLPYSSITLAAGHFKETRKGAWVEAISNILISVILVYKFGIVGVTIGTIVAMTIRTIEFVYHTNKYILNRSIIDNIKKISLIVIETLLIVFICNYLPYLNNINYLNWCINGLMVATVASVVTLFINFMFYGNEFKELFKLLNNIMRRKKKEV